MRRRNCDMEWRWSCGGGGRGGGCSRCGCCRWWVGVGGRVILSRGGAREARGGSWCGGCVSGDVLNGGAWGCPAGTAGGEEQRWGVDWGEGVRMWMGEVRWELQ